MMNIFENALTRLQSSLFISFSIFTLCLSFSSSTRAEIVPISPHCGCDLPGNSVLVDETATVNRLILKTESGGDVTAMVSNIARICESEVKRSTLLPTRGNAERLARALTSCFVVNGYLTTFVSESALVDDSLELKIHEGSLTSECISINLLDQSNDGQVDVEGVSEGVKEGSIRNVCNTEEEQNTDNRYKIFIRDRVLIGVEKPLKTRTLEDQLILLQTDDRVAHLEASLHPANLLDRSVDSKMNVLTVGVRKPAYFETRLTIDNHSSGVFGESRLGFESYLPLLTEVGDSLRFSYKLSNTGGLRIAKLNYRRPLSLNDNELIFQSTQYETKITDDDFETLNIEGENTSIGIQYRHPHKKTLWNQVTSFIGLNWQRGQTFIGGELFQFDPNNVGVSSTRTISLGVDYLRRKKKREELLALTATWNMGLYTAEDTQNTDRRTNKSSNWLILSTQYSRKIAAGQVINGRMDLQISGKPLLPSEQFSLGGAYSVRGYASGARTGDSGFRISIDADGFAHHNLSFGGISISPFFDMGGAWRERNQLDNSGRLIAGFGLRARFDHYTQPVSASLDLGFPLQNVIDQTSSRKPVIHLSVVLTPQENRGERLQ